MKAKGIEEILDDLFKDEDVHGFIINDERYKELKDYIIKLQVDKINLIEETGRLKSYKDFYKFLLNQSEDHIKQLIKKLNDYKQRNGKVIEYIDEHTLFVNGGIIKSILNGSDENE